MGAQRPTAQNGGSLPRADREVRKAAKTGRKAAKRAKRKAAKAGAR